MEGTGGMVAVVQGLQNAGLAVTLLSSRYRLPGRSIVAGLAGAPPASQPCRTADSATETVLKNTLYKSSYQLAHCQPSTSSAFPPARLPRYSLQGSHQHRCSTSRTHDEQAFVASLRNYPISPVRSRSADLIERMLSYTQSKNGPRHSKTRSAKSLPSKEETKHLHSDEIPTRDTGLVIKDLKPNFGYKRNVELTPVTTNNRISRHDNQIGMYDYLKANQKDKISKGSEVRYLTNVKQCLRERLRQICDENPATICPKIRDRYSEHQRQCPKAEASQTPQKVNYCKKFDKRTDCKGSITQDCLEQDIQTSPSTSSERKESRVKRSLSPFKHSKACFCDRPAPCNCKIQPSRSILQSIKMSSDCFTPEFNRHNRCLPICEYDCNKSGDLYIGQLRKIMLNWLQELPVYANFNTKDAKKREEIINELIDTIGQLKKDDTYLEKCKSEVKKYLEILPMWRPENKIDQESFENQLAFNLVQKIQSEMSSNNELKDEISKWIDSIQFMTNDFDKEKVVNELNDKLMSLNQNRSLSDKSLENVLKAEITGTLNDLPIKFTGPRNPVVNNIAQKLVDKLRSLRFDQPSSVTQPDIKNLVLNWVKDFPQISDNINLTDDYSLVNDLITELDNLQNKDTDNYKEQMNDVITNWLNIITEKKKCQIDSNTQTTMTSQLLNNLIDLRKRDHPNISLNDIVKKWFHEIADTLGVNFIDNQSNLEILPTKLHDLLNITNTENRQNTMRQEILKWLRNLKGNHRKYIDTGMQENFVNKLINVIEANSSVGRNISENSLIIQNISKWFDSQPEFTQDKSLGYKDMVIDLSEKLQDVKKEIGDFTVYDVEKELTNWFNKLSEERGIQIGPNERHKLQDIVMSSIRPTKRRKTWNKLSSIQKLVSKEVSDIINNSAIKPEEIDKNRLKDQIMKLLIKDLNAIHSTRDKEPISNIMNLLKQETSLLESQITTLTHDLIGKVKEATLASLGDTIQDGPFIIDNSPKVELKNKVEYALTTLPLKDKQQVIDIVTDVLAKNSDVNIDRDFEVIYEALKKASVSEAEAQEIIKRILNIKNQLKNEVTDMTDKPARDSSTESLWKQKQIFMQRLEQEMTDFMEKVSNESNSFSKGATSVGLLTTKPPEDSINHYNKFKVRPLKTSTPTKTDSGHDLNIKRQIKEIITNWITSLNIDDIADESFKDEMANDIATDIIDRQRYIHLSNTKRSSQDQMEDLKYQVFKWTSKLPNQVDLTTKVAEIKSLIKSLKALEIPTLIRETRKLQVNSKEKLSDVSLMKYNDNIVTQGTGKLTEENIHDAIWYWLNEISNLKPKSPEDKRNIDGLINDLSRKIKYILTLDPNTNKVPNVENLYKDEIVNCFKKLNCHLQKPDDQLEHNASDLLNYLKSLEFSANNLLRNKEKSREAINKLQKKDAIKKVVQDWCQKLPFEKIKTSDNTTNVADNLAEAVSRYLVITDTDMKNEKIFMDDILENLKKMALQFNREDSKYLPQFTERLIKSLKDVLNNNTKFNNSTQNNTTVRKNGFKKGAQIMYDNIQNWCENLPLDLGMINESVEQMNMIKQDLAGKLLKKVGELNLDPEIFHDDYLYEDALKDEIEKFLDSVPKTEKFEKVLSPLKENLIKDILEAKEEMKNEKAVYTYKQQLRDAISKTLSSIGLSILEETPLEVLKDNLADAFISLHYVADDKDLKQKFKDRIFNEVNKFCEDYVKRNPSLHLNANELNQELYTALKKVPAPKDESMRREVEQIRVKDIVTDWFKNLSLDETPSHVQENKIISILAKRLHEIENESEFNPDMDVEDVMNNEISKWLKKFKLKSKNLTNTEPVKKRLIKELKATKNSRNFTESSINKPMIYDDLTSESKDYLHYPASNLNADDRDHLQRIKDRISVERTVLKPDDRKDASLSSVPTSTVEHIILKPEGKKAAPVRPVPILTAERTIFKPEDRKESSASIMPISTGIQTEEKRFPDSTSHKVSLNASIQTIDRNPEPPTIITPQVIVKEYYWDSHGSPTMQRSGSIVSSFQSPMPQLVGSNFEKTNITHQQTPYITKAAQTTVTSKTTGTEASQTIPMPASKATATQGASIGPITKIRTQNESIGTSPQNSMLTKLTKTTQPPLSNEVESEAGHHNLDDYIQLNFKKKAVFKCHPCRGRAVLSEEYDVSPEVGTTKTSQLTRSGLQQMGDETNERVEFHRNKPEFWSAGETSEHKNCLDDQDKLYQPCFRRPICQIPTKDIPCFPKHKRRNQQACTCRNPILTKCSIPSQSPCQHSIKSCYIPKTQCPKCWDGYCPHPSYLYFRQD